MTTPKTQSHRVWVGGGAVGAVALAAIGWFALIGPEMSGAASVRAQTADVQSQNIVLQSKVNRLRAQADQLPLLTGELQQAQTALPSDSGLPAYTRQLLAQATKAGVRLTGITAGTPSLVTPGLAGAATAAPASANPAGHIFTIPVNVISTGSLVKQRALLEAIQQIGPRRALVTSTQFAPTTTSAKATSIDTSTTMTVLLQVFVAPQTPQAAAEFATQLGTK